VLCIDIGTRRTRTTDQCQEYLEFKPHTDLAIANGIAHLLIKNDVRQGIRRAALQLPPTRPGTARQHVRHADELRASTPKPSKEYTPEHVEELSGVPAEKIRMLGDLFGDREEASPLWCMGMNQHTRGTAINCLVHSIHLLSGHFGTPGDSPTSSRASPPPAAPCAKSARSATSCPAVASWRTPRTARTPKTSGTCPRPHQAHARLSHRRDVRSLLHAVRSRRARIDTLWVQVTNPGQTLPNLHKLFNRKKELEGQVPHRLGRVPDGDDRRWPI
jgi:nitrate reductase (cytochrome)